MKLQGIDVSKHQGTITWSSLKGKIDFAIIRAGYGRYAKQKDAQMDNNVKGAKANGIPYGFYWYSYATTVAEAKQEAQVCLQVIKGTDPTWPVFFDQEYEPGILALSTQTRTDICKAFMDAIKAAGYKTGLYCSYDWLMNKVYRAQLDGYDKWVAQYANSCSYTGDDKVIWQYSSSGRLSGINTNVDMNYGYKDYNTDTDTKGTGKWQKYADGRWRWVYEDGSYDISILYDIFILFRKFCLRAGKASAAAQKPARFPAQLPLRILQLHSLSSAPDPSHSSPDNRKSSKFRLLAPAGRFPAA